MEFTIKELIDGKEAFIKLFNSEIPAVKAFHLSKSIKRVNDEYSSFIEVRNKLLDKYGTKNKDNDSYVINDKDGYSKELEEVFLNRVNIDFPILKISELSTTKLTAFDMELLNKIIEE